MKTTFSGVQLRAVSVAVPQTEVAVADFATQFGLKEVNRIAQGTGIHHLRVANKQTATSLALLAAEQLMQKEQLSAQEIDGIVFVSQTADQRMPATSVLLQHHLGLSKDTVAFDINYGCSGYIYGLYQAAMLIQSKSCQRVLVIAGDKMTPYLREDDHHVRLVFGDAFSASLVEQGQDEWHIALGVDGSGAEFLHAKEGYLYMDGAKVMEFALREVPPVIDTVLDMAQWDKEHVDCYMLHQANAFMVKYLQRKMRLSQGQVPIAVEGYGNTGPASIPLALCQVGAAQELAKTVLCGFGIGLSWGALTADLSATRFYHPICATNQQEGVA